MYCMIFLALRGALVEDLIRESVTVACLESSVFTF